MVFLVVIGLLTVETVQAQGTAFTYQGRLNTVGGPANGSYDLIFTIYATNSDGSAFAGPLTNSAVGVSNGLFTVTLDFGSSVFDGNPRWLEIGVGTNGSGSFTTLSPRQALLPAPYAIAAGNLVGSVTNQVNSAVQAATNTFVGTVTNIVTGQGYVTSSITNGLAPMNYVTNAVMTATNNLLVTTTNIAGSLTNGFVTASVTNGLATTNYVITATNNFGNSVAVTMTNGANSFTGNGGELTNLNATNVVYTMNTFASASNTLTLNNGYWLLQTSGNGAITNVIGQIASQPVWSTLWVSNSSGSAITFSYTAAGMAIGSATTNQLSIAAGKMGAVSVFGYGSAFTNYCTAAQQ